MIANILLFFGFSIILFGFSAYAIYNLREMYRAYRNGRLLLILFIATAVQQILYLTFCGYFICNMILAMGKNNGFERWHTYVFIALIILLTIVRFGAAKANRIYLSRVDSHTINQ